jgi:hypothetical protein
MGLPRPKPLTLSCDGAASTHGHGKLKNSPPRGAGHGKLKNSPPRGAGHCTLENSPPRGDTARQVENSPPRGSGTRHAWRSRHHGGAGIGEAGGDEEDVRLVVRATLLRVASRNLRATEALPSRRSGYMRDGVRGSVNSRTRQVKKLAATVGAGHGKLKNSPPRWGRDTAS